jgi:hypothetical protein
MSEMTMTKPLGRSQGGITETVVDDFVTKKSHVIKTQDVSGIMQAAKELPAVLASKKNNTQTGSKLVGTIPIIIGLQWAQESGTRMYTREFFAYCRKKLKDPDFNGFRVGDH